MRFLTKFLLATIAWTMLHASALAGAFTPGNLVVLVNSDTTATSGSAVGINLQEYTTSGTLQQTITVSSSGTTGNRLTQSTSATTEGHLSRSADGLYLTFVGYDANAGTADIANSSTTVAPAVLRVLGKVDTSGTVSLGTNTTSFSGTVSTASNIRAATTVDGSRYWISGGTGQSALRTITDGTTNSAATTVDSTINPRAVHIFNDQLYGSTASTIFRTNTALPTGSSSTTNLAGVTGFSDGSGFLILDRDKNGTVDTLYVADRSTAADKGLLKFTSNDGINWTAKGNIAGSINSVTGVDTGSGVDLYVTTGDGTSPGNLLRKLTDTGDTITGTYTTLATAAAGTSFRSVQFGPAAVPEPGSILLVGMAVLGGAAVGLRRRFRSSATTKPSV